MTPLQHAGVTVIKLHGDYADLDMRNTVDELDSYPRRWNGLLGRVFDEYGLIIAGWSGEWDRALTAAIEKIKLRRYPLYWDGRSSTGAVAGKLITQHRGTVVHAVSADAFFVDLQTRIEAIDQLASPP